MAETKKKSTGGTRTSSSASSRSGASSSRSTGSRTAQSSKKKASTKQSRPVRREVGAVVCLLLAFFAAFGYFDIHALFIDFFVGLLKGLLGYGFWLTPPALLVAAYILAFHRGRPVRLRLWCILLLPVVMGCIFHVFLFKEDVTWSFGLFSQFWATGRTMESGGAVSGMLAFIFVKVFSKVGSLVIFIVAAILMLFTAFNRTLAQLVDAVRSRPRREYDPEEEWPEPPHRRAKEQPEPELVPEEPVKPKKARAAIDIPVDDPPMPEREEKPVLEPKKKKFFNREPRVPAPDQLLTGTSAAAAPAPEVEPEPEPAAPPEPIPEPEPAPAPVLQSAAPVQPKVKPEEAAQAAAEVTAEIEESMGQPAAAYQYPPVSLLVEGDGSIGADALGELKANQNRLAETIRSFGIEAKITNVTRGPSVTRYEVELDQGVRLNKLTNLADDIALALGASGVRIAPIPDKISMVGIEVPNKLVSPVYIHDVIDSAAFRNHDSKVAFALGKDIGGNCIVGNIAKLPHLLIAGTTGSGKSVCTNSLIISLLYKATPEEVRLIMVDPKMVELGIYNGIPHLLIPVVTDPKKAAGALQWAVTEMMKRYRAFSEVGVRDLKSYNAHAARDPDMEKMPQIVVVIDELADLMLVAAKEVEESICRVAQMGRAAGMHLVIATQRPSADVITGLMKANIPSRIAFAVASALESRIILDTTGAEKLVGRGDMLYFPLGAGKPTRVQGCLISDQEVADVVEFVKKSGTAQYDDDVLHEIELHAAEKEKGSKGVGGSAPEGVDDEYDELLPAAIEVVLEQGQASVSMLQRRLKLGYSRAARLVDQMEEKGIVGPFEGSKARQILITKEQWQEMQFKQDMNETAVSEPVPEEFPFEGDAFEQEREHPPFDM
ncbi:MAG: DNA translocase FtsK [Oscillospiraceae bacterium]